MNDEKFPHIPTDWRGSCKHKVGYRVLGGLNCACCGWFVPDEMLEAMADEERRKDMKLIEKAAELADIPYVIDA